MRWIQVHKYVVENVARAYPCFLWTHTLSRQPWCSALETMHRSGWSIIAGCKCLTEPLSLVLTTPPDADSNQTVKNENAILLPSNSRMWGHYEFKTITKVSRPHLKKMTRHSFVKYFSPYLQLCKRIAILSTAMIFKQANLLKKEVEVIVHKHDVIT